MIHQSGKLSFQKLSANGRLAQFNNLFKRLPNRSPLTSALHVKPQVSLPSKSVLNTVVSTVTVGSVAYSLIMPKDSDFYINNYILALAVPLNIRNSFSSFIHKFSTTPNLTMLEKSLLRANHWAFIFLAAGGIYINNQSIGITELAYNYYNQKFD